MGKRIPSYRLYKATGKAVVTLNGKDHFLVPFGSVESREAYGRLIAQHANGITTETAKTTGGLTVNELVLAFMRHADHHYRKNGEPNSEIHCLKMAVRPLVKLYGETTVDDFGPLALKANQQATVEKG